MKSFSENYCRVNLKRVALMGVWIALIGFMPGFSRAQTTMGTSSVTGVIYDSSGAAGAACACSSA
jgi:hypothetical protein